MNQGNLQKLFDSYIEKYGELNDAEHHEIYKWSAVCTFQEYWDIDAEHFGEMFEKAVSASEDLIDDALREPSAGIIWLCRKGQEKTEAVREAFRNLCAPDRSNYAKRQKRAAAFVDTINALLDGEGCEEQKYRQDVRAAVAYLTFTDPDDNFFYRDEETRSFASFVRYTGKIGSGKSFSLSSYYRMCGQVSDALQEAGDLQETVRAGLEQEAQEIGSQDILDIDGSNHILTYDLIYCAQNYDFYDGLDAVKKSGGKARTEEAAAELAGVREKAERIRQKLELLKNEREACALPDLTGRKVNHKRFGEGVVEGQDLRRLQVSFPGAGSRKFILPDAFAKGFLSVESEEDTAAFEKAFSLGSEIEAQEREFHLLEFEIGRLEG